MYVVKRVRRVYGEADEDDVGVGVAEGSEPVVVFLAGSIPQRKFDVLAIDLDIGDIVLKHGRDVNLLRGSEPEDELAPGKRTRQRHVLCSRQARHE